MSHGTHHSGSDGFDNDVRRIAEITAAGYALDHAQRGTPMGAEGNLIGTGARLAGTFVVGDFLWHFLIVPFLAISAVIFLVPTVLAGAILRLLHTNGSLPVLSEVALGAVFVWSAWMWLRICCWRVAWKGIVMHANDFMNGSAARSAQAEAAGLVAVGAAPAQLAPPKSAWRRFWGRWLVGGLVLAAMIGSLAPRVAPGSTPTASAGELSHVGESGTYGGQGVPAGLDRHSALALAWTMYTHANGLFAQQGDSYRDTSVTCILVSVARNNFRCTTHYSDGTEEIDLEHVASNLIWSRVRVIQAAPNN